MASYLNLNKTSIRAFSQVIHPHSAVNHVCVALQKFVDVRKNRFSGNVGAFKVGAGAFNVALISLGGRTL